MKSSFYSHTTSRFKLFKNSRVNTVIFLLSFSIISSMVNAQSINIGKGSYSTALPAAAVGPQNVHGQNLSPKVSLDFSKPIQTNDFWSSLIFPFFDDAHSSVLYAHPLNAKAISSGLQIGYTTNSFLTGGDYIYPFSPQLRVGVDGLAVSETKTSDYGDWTVTARWENNSKSMEATLGHGLPFVFFKITGGDAVVASQQTPFIWYRQNEVLGLTIDGKHYGIFAPSGSTWSGSSTFQSSLNGKDYLTVALLPDSQTATIEFFQKHAYAHVTNSVIEWNYDEISSELTSTFTYESELVDSADGNVNETLTALYRHQWKHSNDELTSYSYTSPRGEMKLKQGNVFSTELKFSGILPALPDQGDYDRSQLLTYVKQVANESLSVGPTYENGKAMGRFSHLVHIADQLGATTERDYFMDQLKFRLEDWFTAGGSQEYSYNAEWDVLTGYPSGFGADNQINDHHFHASYAVMSAATIAQYDSSWASQENWGGMVNLLIKDANNWDRTDTQFPFLRSHDIYAGHSWASGHGAFGDGNNQESSSESMNFAAAAFLWGQATGQPEIRDLGIFLYSTEATAIDQYWFDVEDEVFPQNYPHKALGIVWGSKGVHGTWFGGEPEFIHGINILPITSAAMYLGRNSDYVVENYNEVVAERGGQPTIWKDVFWEYLALADPDLALSYYLADPNYQPFDGESRAHTLHWLYNLKKMGTPVMNVFADTPSYSVFKDEEGFLTYVAYNPSTTEQLVTFSDGFSMSVQPKSMNTATGDTPVSIDNFDEKPQDFSLSQNYPNPFNPETNITYNLPKAGKVSLEVYSLLGQKLASLVSKRQSAGTHSIQFNASSLSSGIYFYRLKFDGRIMIKKMTLLK
ncbi:MAG: glycosyl hydrolase [Balneola sp.]